MLASLPAGPRDSVRTLTVHFITLSKDLYTGYTLDSCKLSYTL